MSVHTIDYLKMKSALKEALIEILQERRDLFHDIFAEILADSTFGQFVNGNDTAPEGENEVPTIAEVVAQIKDTPPNPDSIVHGAKIGDMAYIQELLDNPPNNTVSREEWDLLWPQHEAEMKALDTTQALAEGRQ